jgi:O-succinylbenzoate synthase
MKIDQITLRHLSMPLRSHFETSFGRSYTRDCILIELRAEGLTAYGECVADQDPGYSYETVQTAWHILRDFLIPRIKAQPVSDPRQLSAALDFVRGHPMSKGGLVMAFWELVRPLS